MVELGWCRLQVNRMINRIRRAFKWATSEELIPAAVLHGLQSVAGLPYGVLKRVELGAVLATDPDLLLLDEPTSGMGPEEAHAFGATLLELRREFDLTVVMIEHHVPLVAQVCDYVYCLNFGELLAEGTPDQVRASPEVIRAYLGQEADEVLHEEAPA